MKKLLAMSLLPLLALAGAAFAQPPAQGQQQPQTQPQAGRAKPESTNDRASYIIGFNLGRSLKREEVAANLDLIVQGIKDGLAGAEGLLTEQEMQTAMMTFQQEIAAKQQARAQVLAEKNQREGEAFLEANKKKPGVTALPSGLQYEVVQPGSGESPKPEDRVTVHYTGTLIDGTVFDSSRERGQPATFGVTQVIPGWVEALQLMKPGARWKIYLPPSLAYGESGAGGEIGPNAVLIFDVELISVEKGQQQPAQQGGNQQQGQTQQQNQSQQQGQTQQQNEPEKPPQE